MQTSELTPERLRALAETHPERGLVLSLYLNLDPAEFAAADARQTQISSLISDAEAQIAEGGLEHDEETGIREDIVRARRYLEEDLDPDGAHGLALFACSPSDLWETVKLARPVDPAVLVDNRLLIEPLADSADTTRWAVLLASRSVARIFRGSRDGLTEVVHRDDGVHGQHQQGGWSQARYQRSVDQEAMEHLRASAQQLERLHKRRPIDALLIGGPQEILSDIEAALPPEMRERLVGTLTVDVEVSSPDEVLEAAREPIAERDRAHEAEALDRLRAGIGAGGRGAGGWEEVLGALNEQRVEILLLAERLDPHPGVVCPQCGWLGVDEDACPVDGTGLGRREDITEAAAEAAVRQDAEVLRLHHHADALDAHAGVGAVLRF